MKLPLYLFILSLLTSCKQEQQAAAPAPEEETPACCSDEIAPEAIEASADSIYQLGSTWTDDEGKERSLGSLAEYRQENKIDPEYWTLLTGDTDSVQELAVVTGVQYRKTTDKDFAHSNVITILNSKGEIIHRQEGLSADPADTLKAIAAAQ